MELFELTKAMFESPAIYADATKGDKRKNFFMIQRRMAINFPIQANMLQNTKINMEATIDFWQQFLRKKYTKTPFWMFITGVKKAKEEKEKKINISSELISQYCRFYGKDPKLIRDALRFYPEQMIKEIKEFDKIQKELK
ncbi:MAG: hypothetical protein PHF86_00285 [Candidatus Nanoarchaeia archaeon]|nr:hypothetical protein [Candidatus Nanoarchaeia archaeon]